MCRYIKFNKRRKLKLIFLDIFLILTLVLGNYIVTYLIPQNTSKISAVSNDLNTTVNLADVDFSQKFSDKFSNKIVKTKTSYKSPNLSIDIIKSSVGKGQKKVNYYIADFYIANLNCLQSYFADNTYGVGYKEPLKQMSQINSALTSINGDSYSNNRHKESGTIIRNGVVYRNQSTNADMCVLYNNREMKLISPGTIDLKKPSTNGYYPKWGFCPNLLDDNGKPLKSFNTWDYIRKKHTRTAMGYYEPGHYCFLVCDKDKNGKGGLDLNQMANIFKNLGCKAAYNLDGGHSSAMTFGSKVVNKPQRDNFKVSDSILIKEVN